MAPGLGKGEEGSDVSEGTHPVNKLWTGPQTPFWAGVPQKTQATLAGELT